jgi:hypothetical protein
LKDDSGVGLRNRDETDSKLETSKCSAGKPEATGGPEKPEVTGGPEKPEVTEGPEKPEVTGGPEKPETG